tara:strand:+ start:393 stop:1472 length:1080 start_codon:yes stop_codon:yes gene_type:complete
MATLDDEWNDFIDDEENDVAMYESLETSNYNHIEDGNIPKSSNIYISTKTKIAYLNHTVNLYDVFWKIKVNNYNIPNEGVIKKQMKFISNSEEELDILRKNIKDDMLVDEYILNHLNNPESGRIKFKDVRKISIGVCKKDILSYRCKKKSAFYNCFVLILRISYEGSFHEVHVKVFNTGKLEIPGIKNDNLLYLVLDLLVKICKPYISENLTWNDNITTVLINSNFNCGFYVNRAKLYNIIQFKYKISSVYDPCSYPGIQCKFYYNTKLPYTEQQLGVLDSKYKENDYKKISFMIFRTGSVLIVGKCNEDELNNIYMFLKDMLFNEYNLIYETNKQEENIEVKKNKKTRRKTITINVDC